MKEKKNDKKRNKQQRGIKDGKKRFKIWIKEASEIDSKQGNTRIFIWGIRLLSKTINCK